MRLGEHGGLFLRRLQSGEQFRGAQRQFAARQADARARAQHALLGGLDARAALPGDQQRKLHARLLLAVALEHGVRAADGRKRP